MYPTHAKTFITNDAVAASTDFLTTAFPERQRSNTSWM